MIEKDAYDGGWKTATELLEYCTEAVKMMGLCDCGGAEKDYLILSFAKYLYKWMGIAEEEK